MQITNEPKRSKMVGSMLAAFVIGFGASAVFVFFQRFSLDDFVPEPTTQARSLSRFEFAGVPGWRQGPRNESSITLFSKAREDGTSACFVTVQYKAAKVDVEAALKQQKNDLVSTGAGVTQVSVTPSTFRANSGEIKYDMYRYKVMVKGDSKTMGGLGIGYLEFDNDHVRIEEHCETVEELQDTTAALQSLKLLQ